MNFYEGDTLFVVLILQKYIATALCYRYSSSTQPQMSICKPPVSKTFFFLNFHTPFLSPVTFRLSLLHTSIPNVSQSV